MHDSADENGNAACWLGTWAPSLLDITFNDITAGLDRGAFTCVDLVEAYLARTAEVNDDFRPVIEVNREAVAIAESLDTEIKSKGRRGYLVHYP